MMTKTSYPTATSHQQQSNTMEYGYGYGNGNGNYHYPTATATTTTGYRGSAQNAYNPYQQTSQSNTRPNPPSPQSIAYPPLPSQSQSKPHQPSSYGTMPMTDVHPRSTAVKPPAPVQVEKNQYDGETAGAATKEKTKRRWSFYGRSKESEIDPRDISTAAVSGDQKESLDNDKTKHDKAKRRWSFYNRSKNETNDKTETASVRSSPNIPSRAIVPSNAHGNYPPTEAAGDGNQQHPGASKFRPAEVHPDKIAMKQDRKAKMAGGATTGAIVGAVLTGPAWPVGAMAGAAIGSYASKVTARAGERRQQRKWEQKAFNDYLATGKAGVQREGVVLV